MSSPAETITEETITENTSTEQAILNQVMPEPPSSEDAAAPLESTENAIAEANETIQSTMPFDADARVLVERTLENGTQVRATIAPLPNERIRVIHYERKTTSDARFSTATQEEGQEMHFDLINVPETWDELFGFPPEYTDEPTTTTTSIRRARGS